jgi:CRP-like cAMP-binding protein
VPRAELVQAARGAGVIAKEPGRSREAAGAWATVLSEIPLFAHISKRHIRKIAAQGSVVRFDAGATIVRARQTGDAFYVVLDGKGSVMRGRSRPPVPIGVGSYFGEMALLDSQPRSATVVADTELACLRVGRTAFLNFVRREPSVSLAILRALAERVRDLEKDQPGA